MLGAWVLAVFTVCHRAMLSSVQYTSRGDGKIHAVFHAVPETRSNTYTVHPSLDVLGLPNAKCMVDGRKLGKRASRCMHVFHALWTRFCIRRSQVRPNARSLQASK